MGRMLSHMNGSSRAEADSHKDFGQGDIDER